MNLYLKPQEFVDTDFYIQESSTQQLLQQICPAEALLENCHLVPTYKAIPTRKK